MLINKKLAALGTGFTLLAIAGVSPVFGDVITGGTYTGGNGDDVVPGLGFPGDPGYTFDNGASTVSGGTFTGGTGGSSTASRDPGFAPSKGGPGGNGALVYLAGTTVAITGGSFTGGIGGAASGGGTDGDIGGNGGNGLEVYSNGAATVSGGSFAGAAAGSPAGGSAGYSFYTYAGGAITIVGTFQDAPASPLTNGSGSFTGTLADNSTPATYTYYANGGTLTFTSVPEPASLGLLAVGGITLLRRRRAKSA